MNETKHGALGSISQHYGDRAFTVEPVEGGQVSVRPTTSTSTRPGVC